jgi:hypothetical protein
MKGEYMDLQQKNNLLQLMLRIANLSVRAKSIKFAK